VDHVCADTARLKLFPKRGRASLFTFCDVVFSKPPVVEEVLFEQKLDDFIRHRTKSFFKLLAKSHDRVVARSQQLQCMRIDFFHGDILGVVYRLAIFSVTIVFMTASGCGYRLASKKLNNGAGQTIAVPTFTNKTTTYRIEQRLTDAVRRELIRRTRFNVVPDETGDVVMAGEVLSYTAVPIIFNDRGRGSSYSILVDVNVRLTDTKTGAVLFQNDRWTFREVFELAQNSGEFVPEDTPALERLARRFASSLVASVLYAKP
jgi:hypothetical protein